MRLLAEQSMMPADTVSFIIIEASDHISHERLHQLVGSSLPQLSNFRSRLVERPLGVGPPSWVEIDDYDPTSQIHRATLQAPGGQREFADLIAQLSVGSLVHREMFWEAWSIAGLSGGRWALAVRLSPELSDRGVGTVAMWSRILGDDRSDDPSWPPSPDLHPVGDLVTVLTELLELQIKGLWLIAETATSLLRALLGVDDVDEPDPMPPAVSSMSGPLPRNVFNAVLTDRRAVAFASIPLADLETVSVAFGGDIANVFLAACTLSLRAWLQRHDTVPDNPLLIRMPLALSPAVVGNLPGTGHIRLPVQLGDPVEVLTNLHTASERMYTEHLREPEKTDLTADLVRVASLIPSTIVRAGRQIYRRLGLSQRPAPLCHGSVAYVSADALPAYRGGAEVVGLYTVAPLLEGCGLNITLTTHGDAMHLSVCVCPDNVPAVGEIVTGIVDSLDVLMTAARKSPRGQGRSVVTEMTSHAIKRQRARGF
jgi:diacylglycerol O-acyltransferase / wax synthase